MSRMRDNAAIRFFGFADAAFACKRGDHVGVLTRLYSKQSFECDGLAEEGSGCVDPRPMADRTGNGLPRSTSVSSAVGALKHAFEERLKKRFLSFRRPGVRLHDHSGAKPVEEGLKDIDGCLGLHVQRHTFEAAMPLFLHQFVILREQLSVGRGKLSASHKGDPCF